MAGPSDTLRTPLTTPCHMLIVGSSSGTFRMGYWVSVLFSLPARIWYRFDVPRKVTRFSFGSDPDDDDYAVADGPTKFLLFASNASDYRPALQVVCEQ
jgi:hypothetical protein